ncbi:hypothetical protein COU00_01880 [Candidatus Falkowbacteria bacterium CG10_big_fil_rev_8_21_14_0_10_43_11]|uniref:Uncharacterized protein n=1 Tax=Candidatus Falkowbacteria bacterium CG10_big_fil_rev_8_21_14_0_10_43_11 TaxID=1974568 RepID=A0A2M6WM55_9BACT|nr:MAG: hypothetical protein COU00_01880 [Candidatus Falkowbacteria bacterium CG10_big_fil_rev_8_21_14_0_10_43_11]
MDNQTEKDMTAMNVFRQHPNFFLHLFSLSLPIISVGLPCASLNKGVSKREAPRNDPMYQEIRKSGGGRFFTAQYRCAAKAKPQIKLYPNTYAINFLLRE